MHSFKDVAYTEKARENIYRLSHHQKAAIITILLYFFLVFLPCICSHLFTVVIIL